MTTHYGELVDNWNVGDELTAEWCNAVAVNVRRAKGRVKSGGLQYLLSHAAGNFSGADIPEPGIFFYNNAGSDIPPYGVALTDGGRDISGGSCPQSKQPNSYGCQENFLINGGGTVSSGQFGYAQFGEGNVYIAAYDPTNSPNAGEMWGPRSGTYLLNKDYAGFIVIRIYDSTNHYVLVRSAPMRFFRGKTTHSITPLTSNGSFKIDIYVGTPGSETQPDGNPQMDSIWNGTQCTVNSGKMIGCTLDSANTWWHIVEADTS